MEAKAVLQISLLSLRHEQDQEGAVGSRYFSSKHPNTKAANDHHQQQLQSQGRGNQQQRDRDVTVKTGSNEWYDYTHRSQQHQPVREASAKTGFASSGYELIQRSQHQRSRPEQSNDQVDDRRPAQSQQQQQQQQQGSFAPSRDEYSTSDDAAQLSGMKGGSSSYGKTYSSSSHHSHHAYYRQSEYDGGSANPPSSGSAQAGSHHGRSSSIIVAGGGSSASGNTSGSGPIRAARPQRMIKATAPLTMDKPFKCQVPGCPKSYKNPNGLKYHMEHGHGPEENDGDADKRQKFQVVRPYKCPYHECDKRYKNPNGLKYHLEHAHHDYRHTVGTLSKRYAS